MTDSVASVTVFRKIGGPLTKRIELVDGAIRADGSACVMAEGEARVMPAPTASALAELIAALGSDQALAIGALRDGVAARVVPKRAINGHCVPGIIARTADEIVFRPSAPAWALLDFDTKGMPPAVRENLDRCGGFFGALTTILPEIAQTARVSRASTSAGLRRADTGESLPG